MEFSNDEDRKIFLSPKTAQRIFSEQIKDLVEEYTGASDTVTSLQEILVYHKKKYGYQIMPQTLGFHDMLDCIKSLPYVEVSDIKFYHICIAISEDLSQFVCLLILMPWFLFI